MGPTIKKVFVGMSGGVDSSVTAALLVKQGLAVTGVFIKAWEPPTLANQPNICTWRDDRRDAMRVAAVLNIPFITIDLAKEYKTKVVDYMISEYQSGRTPNPDVVCNQEIKFGAFYTKAISLGADYVATGHYARLIFENSLNNYVLKKGVDSQKDQSYFLWNLTNNQLSKILFPIGHYQKNQVRSLAKKFNLPTAGKKDSQGLCFVGQLDIVDFLKENIPTKAGLVVDTAGTVIGEHQGVFFSTLGQRHGFTVTNKKSTAGPYYVIAKNIRDNILVVAQKEEIKTAKKNKTITISKANWISNQIPQKNKIYQAQLHYHGSLEPCHLEKINNVWQVNFKQGLSTVPAGQSLVIYDGDICLGGGIIA